MQKVEIRQFFDQQAADYDQEWGRLSPIRSSLLFQLKFAFSDLPDDAQILCVGAGTGTEMSALAQAFPGWRFTAVDPSPEMLKMCRRNADREGYISRCAFHEAYLDTLPDETRYDGATSILVSHFILAQDSRTAFFQDIAKRLKPGGILVTAELASDRSPDVFMPLQKYWLNMLERTGNSAKNIEQMRAAIDTHVAILPPNQLETMIKSAGFETPVRFFQAGPIHGWFTRR